MTIYSYCKSQGYTLEQAEQYKEAVIRLVDSMMFLVENHPYKDTGAWLEMDTLIASNTPEDVKMFMIQEFKKRGVEFNSQDNTWRY